MSSSKFIVGSVVFLSLVTCNIANATIYMGSLSTDAGADGSLVGVGGSWGAGSTLTWKVDTGAIGGVSYEYALTVANVPAAGISHVILETSPNFTESNLLWTSVPGLNVGYYSPNPGSSSLPSEVYGIKHDLVDDGKSFTFSFLSDRLPIWGDFYAKGGGGSTTANQLWNAGFGTAAQEADSLSSYYDPTEGPSSGSIRNHVLVPDTETFKSSLRIIKYYDADGDGAWDGDPLALANRLANWSVGLDGNYQPTDSAGVALFGDVSLGSHSVNEVLSSGWTFTGGVVVDPDTAEVLGTFSSLPGTISVDRAGVDIYIGNIPEPAALTLLVLGGLLSAIRRRR